MNRGTFSLYTEMAAKDGKFLGYVKPIITDLKVLGSQDRHDNFFHKIWESLIGAVGFVFKNQNKDQLATFQILFINLFSIIVKSLPIIFTWREFKKVPARA